MAQAMGVAGEEGERKRVPQVYLIIRGCPRSQLIVIGRLVVIVERLRGLRSGKGEEQAGRGRAVGGEGREREVRRRCGSWEVEN